MRKIIIFGANSAIAQACARLWAEAGHELFLVGRDAKRLEVLAADLKVRNHTVKVASYPVDLSDTSQHANIYREAKSRLGGFDTIFIAHGILGEQKRAEVDFTHAREILDINLISPLSLLTHASEELETKVRGNIAVITSVAGDRGRQSNYVYGTSKGALSIYLSGLRNRYARRGIAVTDIRLGFVDTPMTREFKKGLLWQKPEAVARKIVRAIDQGADIAYTPWFWRFIMLIIKSIPERIFKKLKL